MKPQEFRQIRERLGLTQKELAEVFGLSNPLSISHYETGFRTPSVLIQSLMRIFDEWPEKRSRDLRSELKVHAEQLQKRQGKKS